MPKKLFRKISPSQESLKTHKSLRSIAHLLEDPNLFHLNRHSVSRAFAVGLGTAMTPIWGHMIIAALLAIWCRANMAISLLTVWVSNPLTMAFIIATEYWVGLQILGTKRTVLLRDIDSTGWQVFLLEAWKPVLVGSIVVTISVSAISYFSIQLLWRYEVARRWRARAEGRTQK